MKIKRKYEQQNMFGEAVAKPKPRTEVVLFTFESHGDIRGTLLNGKPAVVAADVCRILGLSNVSMAVVDLDDDERGISSIDTPSGKQNMIVVNESGFYALAFKSRKPDAKRFRKWVTSEVLPALRSGRKPRPISYRTDRWIKGLQCDHGTAVIREEDCQVNKKVNHRIGQQGGTPEDFRDYYNSHYRGFFGDDESASTIRKRVGAKPKTPISNLLHAGVLATMTYAKVCAEEQICLNGIPIEDQSELCERTARKVSVSHLALMGDDAIYQPVEDARRGKIIAVVKQLEAPK